MAADRLANTLFYSMEKAVKAYRQFAQQNLDRAGFDITIDQWLVLKTLQDNPDTTLAQIGRDVFKDVASITRIVQLLEKKGFVRRVANVTDKRRATLALTRLGKSTVKSLQPVITANRTHALTGLRAGDIKRSHEVFAAITANCQRGTPA